MKFLNFFILTSFSSALGQTLKSKSRGNSRETRGILVERQEDRDKLASILFHSLKFTEPKEILQLPVESRNPILDPRKKDLEVAEIKWSNKKPKIRKSAFVSYTGRDEELTNQGKDVRMTKDLRNLSLKGIQAISKALQEFEDFYL